jgi:4-aminobutyrate aminotransferase
MVADTLPDPIDTVMFMNSGSEAVEGALKLARRATGRPAIIAFEGGFHGRTFGAASVTTSSLNYRVGYEPLLPSVYFTPFPAVFRDYGGDEELATAECMAALGRLTSMMVPPSAVAAILIEPVQGEGGYYPAPPAFVRELRSFCDKHGILLIADEVQSGYARTGLMWGFEHAGIVPDVVCIAKAIANGLPLSAIAARRELQERWGRGAHGSTFGGNPVACAAGIAVLETIAEERLVANAADRGADLTAGLRALAAEDPRIGDVRGPGLMIGIEFVEDGSATRPDSLTAQSVQERAAELGLLLLTCGPAHQVVRWIAPLNVTRAEVAESVEIFGEALRTAPRPS